MGLDLKKLWSFISSKGCNLFKILNTFSTKTYNKWKERERERDNVIMGQS